MRLRTTRERCRSGSTRRPRGYEESRHGVVIYQYFSTPGNEKYFRRSALFRSRLHGSSEQLSLLEPGRSKSNEFSLCATSLLTPDGESKANAAAVGHDGPGLSF